MRKMRLFTALLVVTSIFASVVQAKDEPPVLRLSSEDAYHTFHITTGTEIEVKLSFSELHVSYDPTKLQFMDYTPPAGLAGTAESGVIVPDGYATTMPGAQSSPPEPIGQPVEIPPGTPIAGGGSVTGVVITAVPGGGGGSIQESFTTWRFQAVASGHTTLELMTFRPPCKTGQPCMMMPDFLVSYDLVIEGDTIVPEPENVDAEVITVRPQADEPTINVKAGQVVMFDVSELTPPFHVIYHPGAVRLLAGEELRFLVNPWGMTTRIGVKTSNDELFAVTLAIEPECESCGIQPMPPVGT